MERKTVVLMGEMKMIRLLNFVSVAVLFFGLLGAQPVHADDAGKYRVQKGDTMLTIAAHFDVGVVELATSNGMRWSSWVYVGQEMVIPDRAAGSPAPETGEPAGPRYATDPRVPDPMPELPIVPLAIPDRVTPLTYARVIQDDAPVYSHPAQALQALPPKRNLGTGFVWVSVEEKVTHEGRDYYRINPDEYVLADALSLYSPSRSHGVALAAAPERPFAWILKPVQPTITAGGDVNPESPVYQRYQLVQIFATEQVGEQVWYLIGPNRWINQIYVGKVAATAPPEGVESGARWIQVDLFEQTIAAYEGDRMVYASLVSTGLPGWNTTPGLSRTWYHVLSRKMSGGYNRPDYYFLEDVPWTMYFNRDIALHTAYWHDGFGYKRSHGCVNLAPLDARWLYEWAPEDVWVWVHGKQ